MVAEGEAAVADPTPVPVTVLAGFLGVGKSTLLEKALRNRGEVGGRLALIVNDVAKLNIDAEVLRGAEVVRAEDDLVELSDGCVCCSLGADVMGAVLRVCSGPTPPAAVVIECSGVAETAGLADLFRGAAESDDPAAKLVHLASIITVVDSEKFPNLVRTTDVSAERADLGGDKPESGDKGIAHLLMEQVETADVVVLNKTDKVSEAFLEVVRGMVSVLNPDAEIIATKFGDVPLGVVLPFESAHQPSKALDRHGKKRKRTPKPAGGKEKRYVMRFKVKNVTYKSQRAPFHPERLEKLLNALAAYMEMAADGEDADPNGHYAPLRSIMRAKGIAWMADAPGHVVRLAAAGSHVELHAEGKWEQKPSTGSARQELVFIGPGLDRKAVTALLDEALLTDEEYEQFKSNPTEIAKKTEEEQ